MEIKLDAEAVTAIASSAIFDSLSQDVRDSVIKQAVQFLLTPEKDRYSHSGTKTPLQNAFDDAIRSVAYKVVKEKIENNPDIINAINELLGPLIVAALSGEAEEYGCDLSEKLGQALGSWLSQMARERNR